MAIRSTLVDQWLGGTGEAQRRRLSRRAVSDPFVMMP